MDLKTYAVLEKLKSNSALLDHMVKHETISIDQASDFFKPLLEKEENKEIKLLVDDYPKYLATHVKLHIEQLANNELQVDGEINDQLLSTISLLSGDDNQKIVENAIKSNLTSFSDQDVKLDNLEMSDSGQDAVSNQLPSLTMTAVENAEESDSQQHADKHQQADNQEQDKDQKQADDQQQADDQKQANDQKHADDHEAEAHKHADDQKQTDDQKHAEDQDHAETQEHAETQKQTDDDQKQTDDGQKQTDDGQKQTDDDQKQTGDDQKQTDDGQKQNDDGQKQTDDDQKQTDDDQKQTDDDQKQTDDNGAITAQGANTESASEKATDSKTPQLAYDRKVANTLREAMQFLLSEIKKYKLDEELPNINTKALMM